VRVRVTSTHLQPYGAEWSRPARSSANTQVRERTCGSPAMASARGTKECHGCGASVPAVPRPQGRMYGCTLTEGVMSWAMLPTAKGKCMWWPKRPSMLAPWVRLPQQRRNERLPRTSWGAPARQLELRKQLGRRARGGRRRLVGRMLAADRPASAVPPGGRFVGV